MSRYAVRKENITIAYGYDDMMPPPLGGYFFQISDENAISDENPEGITLNEGMFKGISRSRMAELMLEHGVKNHSHLTSIALDLPI